MAADVHYSYKINYMDKTFAGSIKIHDKVNRRLNLLCSDQHKKHALSHTSQTSISLGC